MADTPQQPNQFNTATLVAFVGGTFIILDPFLAGLGHWIQAHSSIVFEAGYAGQLEHWAEVAVTTYVAWKHTRPTPAAPAEETSSPAQVDTAARLEARVRELEAAAAIPSPKP